MSSEQLAKLAAIEAALKESLELAENATAGPWEHIAMNVESGEIRSADDFCVSDFVGPDDGVFIAHARQMLPAAAKALRVAIKGLKKVAVFSEGARVTGSFDEPASAEDARIALFSIINDWPCDRAREVTAKI